MERIRGSLHMGEQEEAGEDAVRKSAGPDNALHHQVAGQGQVTVTGQ